MYLSTHLVKDISVVWKAGQVCLSELLQTSVRRFCVDLRLVPVI